MKKLISILLVFLLVLPMGACAQAENGGGDMAVTESSGNGYALYGGVKQPNIASVWNKGKYPYAMVCDLYGLAYCLLLSSDAFTYGEDTGVVNSTAMSGVAVFFANPDTGAWELEEEIEEEIPAGELALGEYYIAKWSSYDILNTADNSTYLAASDPIPLDGMNVIAWDGDTSDLEVAEGLYYFVSNAAPALSAGDSVVIALAANIPDVPPMYVDTLVDVEDGSGYLSDSAMGIATVVLGSGELGSGVAFIKIAEGEEYIYTSLFAYPAAAKGPDFSDTTLYVESPEYTDNTADFDIGWTNLPELAYPDNVQYFISAELDDGTTGSPPVVYLGSSDPAEADSACWFSFTGLEPDTEYTLIAKLLYNTTGEFSDFTDSGVEVTYDFTTAAAGSIHRDSFLAGMASGLGATAVSVHRVHQDSWMQGYIVGEALRNGMSNAWAEVIDGVLYIRQADSAAQTDTTLEVE